MHSNDYIIMDPVLFQVSGKEQNVKRKRLYSVLSHGNYDKIQIYYIYNR